MSWPECYCLSVDVEWAHPEVLDFIVQQLNARGLPATFFCTHPGVELPGHERGLHPNFRRAGDAHRQLRHNLGEVAYAQASDEEVLEHVVAHSRSFAPEAIGVRSHSLFYCSELIPIYQRQGLRYDSSTMLWLSDHLQPFQRENEIVELPIYYMDHFDLLCSQTRFRLSDLRLGGPGLKVFDFHPNMVYLNAQDNAHYLDSKVDYHSPEGLRSRRRPGPGVQTLFLELLDYLAERTDRCLTLAQVHARFKEETRD